MNTILIQVYRNGEWRKVSSVEYDPHRQSMKRDGNTIYHTKASAEREANRIMTGWIGSDQFVGCQMRVVERERFGRSFTFIDGWRDAA